MNIRKSEVPRRLSIYWWVNHKQTASAEWRGGYLWSPQTKRNGSTNETYENLRRTLPGDIVFSYAFTVIRAVGVVTGPWGRRTRPVEFGEAGHVWNSDGWMVPVHWIGLPVPFAPVAHLSAIVPLLPEKYAPLQANGHGNQGCYLASIPDRLGELLLHWIWQSDTQQIARVVRFREELLGEIVCR